MLEAYRVMSTDVVTIDSRAPVRDAAKLLLEHKVSGIPVVDEAKKLKGIITEKDVLKLLIEFDSKKPNVADYMTRDVVSFKETDSIVMICEYLMNTNIRRVPILDNDGKLVGIISRRDIIQEILRPRD